MSGDKQGKLERESTGIFRPHLYVVLQLYCTSVIPVGLGIIFRIKIQQIIIIRIIHNTAGIPVYLLTLYVSALYS